MIPSISSLTDVLLQSPHPMRLSAEEAARAVRAEYQSGSVSKDSIGIFDSFGELKAFAVDVCTK